MIKVALNGGLGNQLFQYAAGRALADKHKTDLLFDVIPLYSKLQLENIATYRKYELGIFSIDAKKNDIAFKGKLFYPLAKTLYFVDKYVNKLHYHYFEEKIFHLMRLCWNSLIRLISTGIFNLKNISST